MTLNEYIRQLHEIAKNNNAGNYKVACYDNLSVNCNKIKPAIFENARFIMLQVK